MTPHNIHTFSNGWVALAHQVQNETLLNYTQTFLNYVLSSQNSSGNFGPGPFDTSLPILLWPRYMIMLGLIVRPTACTRPHRCAKMHRSNTPKQTRPRLPPSMTFFITLRPMLHNGLRLAI